MYLQIEAVRILDEKGQLGFGKDHNTDDLAPCQSGMSPAVRKASY